MPFHYAKSTLYAIADTITYFLFRRCYALRRLISPRYAYAYAAMLMHAFFADARATSLCLCDNSASAMTAPSRCVSGLFL